MSDNCQVFDFYPPVSEHIGISTLAFFGNILASTTAWDVHCGSFRHNYPTTWSAGPTTEPSGSTRGTSPASCSRHLRKPMKNITFSSITSSSCPTTTTSLQQLRKKTSTVPCSISTQGSPSGTTNLSGVPDTCGVIDTPPASSTPMNTTWPV